MTECDPSTSMSSSIDYSTSNSKKRHNSVDLDVVRKKKKKYSSHESEDSSDSSSSNESGDSSDSSSDTSSSDRERKKSKRKKKFKKKEKMLKKRKKKLKKKEKKLKKKQKLKKKKLEKKIKEKTKPKINKEEESVVGPIPLPGSQEIPERSKQMAPMTKEECEKKQSVIRRVYDEVTGRRRLIRGDGEVLEEIVSKLRHQEINRQATRGDGTSFQNELSAKLGQKTNNKSFQ